MKNIVTISESQRRESRYRVSDHSRIRVIVRADAASDPIDAQLIDLSNNGLQLRSFGCLKFEQTIEVHVSALELQFDLVGSVKWLRPADESSWFVGCRIEPELSEQTLAKMASMAVLERRSGHRREVRLDAIVCGELEQISTPAVLRNLSEDGFGLASVESHDVGQRIRVQLRQLDGQPIDVSARVVWELKTHDGFVCGCSILNRECYSQLNELAEAHSIPFLSQPPPAPGKTPRMKYWVALAAAVLIVFATLFAMQNDPPLSEPPGLPRRSRAQRVPADSVVRRAQRAPDAREIHRSDAPPTAPPTTDEPLVKTSSRDDSPSPVAPRVTRKEAAAQLKLGLDYVVDLTRQLVESPHEPPSATTAKSTVPISREPTTPPREPISDIVTQQNEPPERAEKSPTEFRTWVDDTGRYRVVARVVAVQDDTVRLLKENGRYASVPLARLSPDDAQYIQRWIQASD
jgi:hypothetical protein